MPTSQGSRAWQRLKSIPLGMKPGKPWPIDPYLVWAEATGYADYPPGVNKVPVLLEFPSRLVAAPEALQRALSTAKAAEATVLNWVQGSAYQTAIVQRHLLRLLVQLQQSGVVKRFQLGAARGNPVLPDLQAHTMSHPPGVAAINTLGVVDDGCCIAHSAFRSAAQDSRFAFVWDQNPTGPFRPPWKAYAINGNPPPGYGGELRQTDIENLLKLYPVPGEAGEHKLYSALDRAHWGQAGRIHGACVLHLLAGAATFQVQGQFPSGIATGLPIIFVQLPQQTAADTSGGSIGFYVLDAVRYIIQRTRDLNAPVAGQPDPKDWCSTINVSLGSLGGPHDGSTIVEKALDEIVTTYTDPSPGPGVPERRRIRIVMAAGNAAERQVHGVRTVPPKGSGRFDIMVPPGNTRESFVELWPQLANPGQLDHLALSVRAPDGTELKNAKVGDIHVLRDGKGKIVASLVFPRAAAQGESGPMILLAIRPTENVDIPTNVAPYGAWTVMVAAGAKLKTAVDVHGWIERNDTVIQRRKTQRTVFIDTVAPGESGGWLSDDSTLSSLANGMQTECVGAFEVNRLRVTDHSSRGPALPDRARPGIHGASDATASLPGIAGPGFFSGTRARFSGTSAAAPRVSRWIAEGADPNRLVTLDAGHSTTTLKPGSPAPMGVEPIAEVDGAPARPVP